MTEDMLVKLRLDGTVISQGERGPSSEVKMHLRVYNENPEVGGVCHAHPPISTSFAIAGMSLDRAIYPEALVNLGTVPCVHYETPGSQGIPDSVAPYCKDYNALLLANHGALAWGKDLMEAWYRLESTEHYAMVIMYTGNIIGKGQRAELQIRSASWWRPAAAWHQQRRLRPAPRAPPTPRTWLPDTALCRASPAR